MERANANDLSPSSQECSSVVEHTADNRAVTSSTLVIPIPLYEEHSEVWQRGLLQNPAKIPCLVIGTVGSNPTTSALESCPSGLWCKLGKFVDIKVPEVQILYSPPGCIVQMVERFSHKEVVGGSIPPTTTV
jgi:hypothetical protein